jgi:hypothetical protein
MALEFPKSFPSWVYGPDGQAKLLDGPNAFAALDPAQWADSPADWFAAPVQEPAPFVNDEQPEPPERTVAITIVDAPEATISSEEIADILDGEVNVGESANVPFEAPAPEPVSAPVKRGPGRPRKVQA